MYATTETEVRIIKQSYHRNGVGGAGFVVSLVSWPSVEEEFDDGHQRNPFVAVSFLNPEAEDGKEFMRAHTAVLSIPLLLEGEIRSAWRGADRVGPYVVEAWEHYEWGKE